MKAPQYVSDVDIASAKPNMLDRHDISIISQGNEAGPKAMKHLGEASQAMGQDIFNGQLIVDTADRQYEEAIRRKQKERDATTIAEDVTKQMETWTKKHDEMWDPANPEGHTKKFMDTYREFVKENTDLLSENDPDYGIAWGRQMAQLGQHLFHMANGREAAGKITKQDEQISNAGRIASNQAYNDTNMERFEFNRNNIINSIDQQSWGNSEMGKRLKEKTNDDMASSFIYGLINKENTKEARRVLEEGIFDRYLNPNSKIALAHAIDRADKAVNSVEKYDLQKALESNLVSMAETGTVTPIDEKRVAKVLGADHLAKYKDDIKMSTQAFGIKSKLGDMPIPEAVAYVESLRPTEAKEGVLFDDQQKLYVHAQKALQGLQAMIKEDSAGYAMNKVQDIMGRYKNDPYIQEMVVKDAKEQVTKAGIGPVMFELQGKQGTQKFAFSALADKMFTYMSDHGIWQGHITPKSMVQADVELIKSLPPQQLSKFMEQKKAQWGEKWFDTYWKDLSTIGKLPTEYKMAMFAQGTPAQNLIINAIRVKKTDLEKAFPTATEYEDVRRMALGKLEPFKRVLNQGSANGKVMADSFIGDMAEIVTKAAAMDVAMGVSNDNKKKAVDNVVKSLINDRFYFVDKYMIPKEIPNRLPSGTVLPPTPVSIDMMNDMKRVLSYLKTEKGMTEKAFMPSSSKNEFDAQKLRKSYEGYGYWVLNGDLDGVYLQYDYPDPKSGWVGRHAVESDHGVKYEFKFKDLMRMSIPSPVSRTDAERRALDDARRNNLLNKRK